MIDLTPSEQRIIIIISVILVLAGVFQLFQPFKKKEFLFDYTAFDSTFSRLSHQPLNSYQESLNNNAKKSYIEPIDLNKNPSHDKDIRLFININTAKENDLKKLPRIGPAIAKRIVEYRKVHGPFKSNNDLQKVKGIGKNTFEKLKPYLQKIK
jgi:competence ComEA-like helix-hairpin-helix protein